MSACTYAVETIAYAVFFNLNRQINYLVEEPVQFTSRLNMYDPRDGDHVTSMYGSFNH